MSRQKLAYQYGFELAARESGYASFNAFEKAAVSGFGNQMRAGGLALASLLGHAHPQPAVNASAHALAAPIAQQATKMTEATGAKAFAPIMAEAKAHPPNPIGAMAADDLERMKAPYNNGWGPNGHHSIANQSPSSLRRFDRSMLASARDDNQYLSMRGGDLSKKFNLPDDHRLLHLGHGNRRNGTTYLGNPGVSAFEP